MIDEENLESAKVAVESFKSLLNNRQNKYVELASKNTTVPLKDVCVDVQGINSTYYFVSKRMLKIINLLLLELENGK